MRKLWMVVAASSLLLLPTTALTQQPPTPLFIIEPGDVVPAPGANARMITGSVTLTSSTYGDASRMGGGCLVYVSLPNAKSCTKDTDCQVGGGDGYCSDSESPAGKVCWHKPDPESCFRSPSQPMDPGRHEFKPATTPYPSGAQRPILWRVLSCQNVRPLGCKNGPEENRVYRYGKIKPFN